MERLRNVSLLKQKPRLVLQMGQVLQFAGGKIIHSNDTIPLLQQPIAQMGSQESGGARHQSHLNCHLQTTFLKPTTIVPAIANVGELFIHDQAWATSRMGVTAGLPMLR